MKHKTWVHLGLAIVVAGLFAWNVSRFYWISDDGYICFRFAENVVAGHGVVYNAGERVEGYTQPIWIALMTIPHLLGTAPEPWAAGIGIASGLGILLTLVLLTWHFAGKTPWAWVAPLCLATNRTFCMWSTGGLETQFFAFLVLCSSVAFLRERERRARLPWASSLLFALATLERPEGAMFFGIAGLLLAWEVLVQRRRSFGALFAWAVPYVVLVGAHELWRIAYYGYLLPNTFYAKVSGAWFEQGRSFLAQFAASYHVLWLLPLFALLPFVRPGAVHLLFAAQVAGVAGYVFYIGGDHFEFRFVTPVLPQFYWLAADAVRRAVEEVEWPRLAPALRRAGGIVVALGLIATSARTLWHVREQGFADQIASWELLSDYAARRVEEGRFLRRLVEQGYLTGDELLAVTGAGALPYYARMPVLDLHGLNDALIAHTPITHHGRIGHEKVATPEYVRKRGVVICDLWNKLVYDHLPRKRLQPAIEKPYYAGPVHCVKALGHYLLFGTTLSEPDFRRTFSKFEIVQ